MSPFQSVILSGFNPDPSITRIGDTFYIVTSSFEYFPGLPIYRSKDLITWELVAHALTRPSQLHIRCTEAGGGIFAPSIRTHKGIVYVTSTCMYRCRPWESRDPIVPPRGFYVSAPIDGITDPTKWSDPIFYDVLGIDQDLFFDDDGKVYLSYCTIIAGDMKSFSSGVFICEIDLETGRCRSKSRLIRRSPISNIAEGSHIYKKDGVYYLSTAEGGTEIAHQQWICRSTAGPYGPWEEGPPGSINPMIFNGDHREIRQTGHADLVEGLDGRWWTVFLGVRPQWNGDTMTLSQLGRETFLAPVEWRAGWPIVNGREPIRLEGGDIPGLYDTKKARGPTQWEADFSAGGLELGWYHLRTPVKPVEDLRLRPGSLAIHGGPYELKWDESPSLLLRKQPDFSCQWSARVDFEPLDVGDEAGVVVWWSKWSYASLSISGVQQASGVGRQIRLYMPDENAEEQFSVVTRDIPAKGMVTLSIDAQPSSYRLSYSLEQGPAVNLAEMPAKLLVRTRKFDSIMEGTFFGLFSHGSNGLPSINPAFFDQVRLVTR